MWWHFQGHPVVLWFVTCQSKCFFPDCLFFRTFFAQIFLMFNWSRKICLTVSLSILTISAVIWMLKCQSFQTISLIFSMFSSVSYVKGHRRCPSSSTSCQPSLNHLCHSKTCMHGITLSPYIILLEFFSFNFTRNLRLKRCSIFILFTDLAEQHNMVTFKQSSEANQLIQWDESSLVWFEKLLVVKSHYDVPINRQQKCHTSETVHDKRIIVKM